MVDRSASFGPVPPYGTAIREAMASRDTTRMRQVRESARQWLKENPGHSDFGHAQKALRELDDALGDG
jgi:hypothetical protein